MLCDIHAPGFDLFVKAEIQIKKAISFTTFHCCHSLLNHKSSVMTDFVCCAGISAGRAEEACGALSDDRCGPSAEMHLHSGMVCFGLDWLPLTSDYAAVCTQEHSLCLV